jgi:hypothetical protein
MLAQGRQRNRYSGWAQQQRQRCVIAEGGHGFLSSSGDRSGSTHVRASHPSGDGIPEENIMSSIDREQRIEEIELGLAGLFASPKAPSVHCYEDGSRLHFQLSWVVESKGDTSLDSRCVIAVRFAEPQIDRYAAMDTAQRRAFRDRLGAFVRQRFDEQYNPPPLEGDCSIELDVDDTLLDVQDIGNSYP